MSQFLGFNSSGFSNSGSASSALFISQAHHLDYESARTLRFQIRVVDRGLPTRRSSLAFVTLLILDVNDNAPTFTQPNYTALLPNGVRAGTPIASVTATDADSGVNADITYSLIRHGAAPDIFHISQTGVVQLSAPLITVPVGGYVLELVARDGGSPSLFNSANLTVRGVDSVLNYTQNVYSAQIAEGSPANTPVATVTAFDPNNASAAATPIIRYGFFGNASMFNINIATGEIVTRSTDFDYETQSSFLLTVLARDVANGPDRLAVTVVQVDITDVNDNGPIFDVPVYFADVPECLTGSLSTFNSQGCLANQGQLQVGPVAIRAVDADAPNTPFSTVSYSLVSAPAGFTISSTTGVVTLQGNPPVLDFETTPTVTLHIRASDQGNPSISSTARLDIRVTDLNDHAPVFHAGTRTSGNRIVENSANGTFVTGVNATDVDTGDAGAVRYSIIRGVGSPPQFAINSLSGAIEVAGPLDFEDVREFTLTVRATDLGTTPGPLFVDIDVNISVTDANDIAPTWVTPTVLADSVMENSPAGVSVLTVVASDGDSPGITSPINTLVYSINRASSGFNHFTIGQSTGEILTSSTPLNREDVDFFQLVIEVRDNGRPQLAAAETTLINITVLDANDNSPVFDEPLYRASIPERISQGVQLFQASATDADLAGSVNTAISFSVVGDDRFVVDTSSGVVSIADPPAGTPFRGFDYENASDRTIIFRLMAMDAGNPQLNGTAQVSVQVTDETDTPPVINCATATAPIVLLENVTNGSFISRVEEIIGAGEASVINLFGYEVVGGPALATSIGSQSGILVTNRLFDFEDPADRSISVSIQAVESGVSTNGIIVALRSNLCNIAFSIADVNDNAPIFEAPRCLIVLFSLFFFALTVLLI